MSDSESSVRVNKPCGYEPYASMTFQRRLVGGVYFGRYTAVPQFPRFGGDHPYEAASNSLTAKCGAYENALQSSDSSRNPQQSSSARQFTIPVANIRFVVRYPQER